MIKPDWNIFKAKFSANPQDNFEWLCYLLFCKEFDKPLGVAGYKNHRHVEHNPIEKDGEIIGWQAKFYDTPLSKHKSEIIKTVQGAKKDYPELTKLIFYTNQNWAQGKKQNEPKAKIEIDRLAKKLGIAMDWQHMDNFFKSSFVSEENKLIAEHFFVLNKSVLDFASELQNHSESILFEIGTHIDFNDSQIEIPRQDIVESINKSSAQIIVLSGAAGVGKTSVIKKLFQQARENVPFYIFKSTEFELKNINEFFNPVKYKDFFELFEIETSKFLVVDSAEKLIDLKNPEPFKELLRMFIEHKWKIIFTTRDSYLEDLNYEFLEIYKIVPYNLHLNDIEPPELESISNKYSFKLPTDSRLKGLIKTPFYLNEFLKYYNADEQLDYETFKTKLWNRKIKKSKPVRELCFIEIAELRAASGQFFLTPDCDSAILEELRQDGVLGYENAGYFITHDIHEEWALEKKIESEFIRRNSNSDFLKKIGQNLPVRRAFRNWLALKLQIEDNDAIKFIEDSINDSTIDSFWKDEILVSVLLSNYSDVFFKKFKELLLRDRPLLIKITFLLRTACKQGDLDFYAQIGLTGIDLLMLKYFSTKPQGHGWISIIQFIYENIDTIGIRNIYFFLPVIFEWNSKQTAGETTRFSSLLALKYYQWGQAEDVLYSLDDTLKNKLFQTILLGSNEIKDELSGVLKEVTENKWKNHRDPYFGFCETILQKLDGSHIAKVLPQSVMDIAELFWRYTSQKDDYYSHRTGVEQYFDLEDDIIDYYPASALKTPAYWLLQSSSFKATVDFILDFTNKSVEAFAKTKFAEYEIEEVLLYINEDTPIKQYISNRLWCIYRGTQTAPHLLESIHMALEKYLLEVGKYIDASTLETTLLYLLKHSKSASISAIVASIVTAYPGKLFNISKILFSTRLFFIYDNNRKQLDQSKKQDFFGLNKMFPTQPENEIFENERKQSDDEKHRGITLENLFFQYQVFAFGDITDEEIQKRKDILWGLLDKYYEELPSEHEQTNGDEIWRFSLARMDQRKISIQTREVEEGVLVEWNANLEPDLQKKSEEAQQNLSEYNKFAALNLWGRYKFEGNEKSKEYKQYEENPSGAVTDVKELLAIMKASESSEKAQLSFLYQGTPADVCAALISRCFDTINQDDREFCKTLILEIASKSIETDYRPVFNDGVGSTIISLSFLFEKYPAERDKIKKILLFNLFNNASFGMLGESTFNRFSIVAIRDISIKFPEDSKSLILGFLYLKPRYDKLWDKIRRNNYEKEIYGIDEKQFMEQFVKENDDYIQKIYANKITVIDVGNISPIDLETLEVVFELIPLNNKNTELEGLALQIIEVFIEKATSRDRDDRYVYRPKRNFLKRYATLLLHIPKGKVSFYLKPFIDKFQSHELYSDLFEALIIAEDSMNSYENFWYIWNSFKPLIIDMCRNQKPRHYEDKIIKSYLFARTPWQQTAVEWHSLKNDNKSFFKEIADNLGHCPALLYSVSKLLYDIGTPYLEDGVGWLALILVNNPNLKTDKLDGDTKYYLENVARKYIYLHRTKIRKSTALKNELLIILDFLIEKVSVIGYILRETII